MPGHAGCWGTGTGFIQRGRNRTNNASGQAAKLGEVSKPVFILFYLGKERRDLVIRFGRFFNPARINQEIKVNRLTVELQDTGMDRRMRYQSGQVCERTLE